MAPTGPRRPELSITSATGTSSHLIANRLCARGQAAGCTIQLPTGQLASRRAGITLKRHSLCPSAYAVCHKQFPLIYLIDNTTQENTTLAAHMCPAAGRMKEKRDYWREIFATSIVERLRAAAPGAQVELKDVVWLMALCPLDALAKGMVSPFCDMFTREEFEGFEYYEDLGEYGQELGRVQGVGYVNELLARLTRTPVRDNTQTNRTLDSSPATFPLDRTVYADFAHASVMIAIYGALGLFPQERDLDPSWADPQRSFVLAKMVPYAARLVTEKMECRGAPGSAGEGVERAEYVRIMVNDAMQPLNCGGVDGICELRKFVESMWYARSDGDGDWDRCWESQEPVES
ncbi:hypothetical protein HWV62_36879 [Athelia sp. TMB]|nr:hypothetical protein HWV62_36879 [Athelia sp. TMB]